MSDFAIVCTTAASLDRGLRCFQRCDEQGRRYARRMLGNESDAAEAVQEAFLRLHRAGHSNFGEGYAYLFFVTLRHQCIDQIRRQRVRKEIRVGFGMADFAAPEPAVDLGETELHLRTAMAELPGNWRDVLILRVQAELTYDEIAEVTGYTRDQVRTWLYRARRQLEQALSRVGILVPSSTKPRVMS